MEKQDDGELSWHDYSAAATTLGDVHKINFHGFDPWLDFVCACILKFIYSEKATKFCEISILYLPYLVTVKSTVEISQNLVAFSEYIWHLIWKKWAEL